MIDNRSKLTSSRMPTVTRPGAIPQGKALVAQLPLAGVRRFYTSAEHNLQLRYLQLKPSSTQWAKPQLRHSTSSKSCKRWQSQCLARRLQCLFTQTVLPGKQLPVALDSIARRSMYN
eukprot:703307-Amphidinium_carterae.1